MDQRLGRLREPRYLAAYFGGGLLSLAAGMALYRITNAALPALAGAVVLGGLALSAQLAKGTSAAAPLRTVLVVACGLSLGALLGTLARI